MTNKEKYKQAFSAIHASANFCLEVKEMKKVHKRHRTAVAFGIACVLILGSAFAAYAANLGGVQRIIQLWIQGEQTNATMEFDGDGSYTLDYTDSAGNVQHRGGGGVAIANDGSEVPLSEEELIAELSAPDVWYAEDGSVWVYWFDQKIDITNRFENDVCYVKLVHGDETLYMTVLYKNGYATSPRKYLQPDSLK